MTISEILRRQALIDILRPATPSPLHDWNRGGVCRKCGTGAFDFLREDPCPNKRKEAS
jgi:hypothetical protein